MTEPWKNQLQTLGAYIRAQRRLANLSLREVAQLSRVSNAYISQIERGLHEPSLRVLRALASALDVPQDDLLEAAGLVDEDEQSDPAGRQGVDAAIRADRSLTDSQKEALLSVYRSFAPASGDDGGPG